MFPIKVIKDAKISPALLILSAIIDWLLLTKPTIALVIFLTIIVIINKNIFPIIPYIPAFLVALNLSSI